MLRIQLDDRALFLAHWQQLLLRLLDDAALAGQPARSEAREQLVRWSGRAAVDSTATGSSVPSGIARSVNSGAVCSKGCI